MPDPPAQDFVLGIDLGSNSLGWAIIALVDGEPHHLIRAGVRVFEAGMEGDLASGREESRNLKRRQMRLQRRQTWRRARRLRKIFNLLRGYGLLPAGSASSPEERQSFLNRLDGEILASPWFSEKARSGLYPEPRHVLPYILRAAALDERLDPHLIGRALYHLAQRRGFASNRKRAAKKDDDEGAVKEGIAELRKSMQDASTRTLGEYFSRLAPSEQRIRCQWTSRDMYEKEFEAIWSAQTNHLPDLLTEERQKELRSALFSQRPLWFDPSTIGRCELESGQRRAPAHLLVSQRFRLLDKVNNLKINGVDLTSDDREKLIRELDLDGDMTFKQMRKLLGLTKDDEINLARGGEERLPGNRTFAKFHKALGQRWLDMASEDRDRLVEYVSAFEKPDKLQRAARGKWNLDDDCAGQLAEISFEPDYLSLSTKAMHRLLPLMERGVPLATARKQVYPDSFRAGIPLDVLPPVDRALAEIRNPAVMRSLTELRKVVNAIVRRYGKPAYVRVELARDLKKSKKARQAISESNRRNEKFRVRAAEEIVKAQVGIKQPKPDDVRKWLLAEECRWQCPYTGKTISPKTLFGLEPQFDIEHIIPFSRSMDNSFQNLTICYVLENRSSKGNRTPHQAYSGDADRYEAILDRVKRFSGERTMTAAKLRRFGMNDEELEMFLEDFRNRQLNDTAYATSLAARYLGLLYGGVDDADGKKRVQPTSGQATYNFRSLWRLNSILNDGLSAEGGRVEKKRTDHRHHAIDAVVIGLTDAGMIKRLADAAQRAPLEHRRRFASLEAPWHNFVDSIRSEVEEMVVSHRVSRKISGALHKETNYSPKEFGPSIRRHRVELKDLGEKDVSSDSVIPDKGVRELIRRKLESLGGGDPGKVFSDPQNLPYFVTTDGRSIPVKKVRIQETIKTQRIGQGPRARYIKPGGNHHLEIFGQKGPDGRDRKWDTPGVVTMLDAYDRLKSPQPVVQRDAEPGWEFRFSLAQGDTLTFGEGPYKGSYLVVRTISEEEKRDSVKIEIVATNDARLKNQIKNSKQWITKSPNELLKWQARKIVVSPLGEVSEAHD